MTAIRTTTLDAIDHPWACPSGRLVMRSVTDREAWLAARKQMVGASEVAQVMGIRKGTYGDRYTVWADKTGRTPMDYSNDRQQFGLDMEDAIIRHWLNITEVPIRFRKAGLMQSKINPRLGATVDRLSICPLGRCVTELKTQADDRDWEDEAGNPEIPVHIQIQDQTQLFVTGRDHVHNLVLGSRSKVFERILMRDQELIDTIVERVGAFWTEHVEADIPPEATGKASDAVKSVFSNPNVGDEYVLTAEDCDAMRWINRAKEVTDRIKGQRDDRIAALQAHVGRATEILWPDRTLAATWRPTVTIDGATKPWVKAHPELADVYNVPVYGVEFDAKKAVADHPELVNGGGLRYRRTFTTK